MKILIYMKMMKKNIRERDDNIYNMPKIKEDKSVSKMTINKAKRL